MAAARPEFKDSFNVETATQVEYRAFIERLRRNTEAGQTINNLPLLCAQPPENKPATHFFDIKFSTKERSLKVRFRRDNLSVVGFVENQVGQWWEYGPSSAPALIHGSKRLGFPSTYNAGMLPYVCISHRALVMAVNDLCTTAESDVRQHAMTVISLTVSEAVRLNSVRDHVSTMFAKETESGLIPEWMLNVVRLWAPLSKAIIVANQEGSDFTIPENRAKVVSFTDAKKEIGMVLRVKDVTDDGIHPAGRPMVEVFSVVPGFNPPGNYYGTIIACDGLSSQYLFSAGEGDPSCTLYSNGPLILTGPSRPMWALGNLSIDISVISKDKNMPIKTQMTWDASGLSNVYDQANIYRYVYEGGYVLQVYYIIIRDAVRATIQVKLMEGDGDGDEDYVKLYGYISAASSAAVNRSMLFQRELIKCITVEPSTPIPLLRSTVAVPLNGTLTIFAGLSDHSHATVNNEQVASGSVIFQAKHAGTIMLTIPGSKNDVEVTVTWS